MLFSLLITGCENSDAIKPVTHLKDGKDSSSYALGADLGENLKKQYVELDYGAFLTGLKFGYDKDGDPLLTKEERKDAFRYYKHLYVINSKNNPKTTSKLRKRFLKRIKPIIRM